MMRKGNWMVIAIAATAALFLITLWFVLGFDHVDSPLDPVLTCVWFIVMAIVVIAVKKAEDKRRERLRRCYVGPNILFNAEKGLINTSGSSTNAEAVARVVDELEYKFHYKEEPENIVFDYVVSTDKFADEGATWKGTVRRVGSDGQTVQFDSREELEKLLSK